MCVFQANLQGYRCPALSLCITTMHNTRTDLNSESCYVLRASVFQIHVRSQSCIHTSHLPLTPFVRDDFFLRGTKCVWKCTRIVCPGLQLMLTNGHNHRLDQSEIKIADTKPYHLFFYQSCLLAVFQPPPCFNPHSKCSPVCRYEVALLLQNFKLYFLVLLHAPFLSCVPQLKMIGAIRCEEKQFITLWWQEL